MRRKLALPIELLAKLTLFVVNAPHCPERYHAPDPQSITWLGYWPFSAVFWPGRSSKVTWIALLVGAGLGGTWVCVGTAVAAGDVGVRVGVAVGGTGVAGTGVDVAGAAVRVAVGGTGVGVDVAGAAPAKGSGAAPAL